MATVHIRFGLVCGGATPTFQKGGRTATITSSGSSQQSTLTATDSDFATVHSDGGNIRIAFGANPTALAGSGEWVMDGQPRDFGPLAAGDKIAIIDLS